jgi:uncharacterized membrane protein YphA (DoxX/SURF4 family)
MITWLGNTVLKARKKRWMHIFVIVLRILIAFAFIPAGLKKVIGQPFTDAANTGIFHEFVQVFHDTGFFYYFVGAMQLLAAVLLMTQRFATLGAVIMTPILGTILVFCWSTWVVPTATVVTLMSLGLLLLLLWDIHKWKSLFSPDGAQINRTLPPVHPTIDMKLWTRCGWAILLFYFGTAAITGEVYRPKGADWSNPNFVVLQVILVLPLLTFVIDYRRSRQKRS